MSGFALILMAPPFSEIRFALPPDSGYNPLMIFFVLGIFVALPGFAQAQDPLPELPPIAVEVEEASVLPAAREGAMQGRLKGVDPGLESIQAEPVMPEFRNRFRDPVSGKTYTGVFYGPVNRSYNPFSNYSYWRNVTVYRVDSKREEIIDLPAIHQSCFDGGTYPMGNWQMSRTITVELRSSLKCEELGLGAEISSSIAEGRTFSMQKALVVPRGVEADYVPVLRKDSWVGVTFIQTYNPETRMLGYLPANLWEEAMGSYPYAFELKNVATVFEVLRKNLRVCAQGQVDPARAPEPEMYIPMQ
jgi:hypothetical protein